MKYLFVLILSLVSLVASAQSDANQILSKLSSKLNGFGSYAMNFNLEIDGAVAGRGECMVRGDKFYIKVLDNVVFSDGINRYEVNNDDKEITIDKIDPNDKGMLVNPAKAFELVGANFKSTSLGRVVREGKNCELLKLVPNDKNSGFSSMKLWVGVSDNLPMALEYNIDGTQKPIVIVLSKIERRDIDKGLFEYSKAKYIGYEIVDFR